MSVRFGKPDTSPRLPPEHSVQGPPFNTARVEDVTFHIHCAMANKQTTNKRTNSQQRKALCKKRCSLSEAERLCAASQISQIIHAASFFRRARHIACYWAVNGEINLWPVIEKAWSMNKTCYLPILDTLGANKLWFAPFTRCSKLKYNRFGIPEPQVPKRHWVRAQSLNLVLTPLVAFDMQGNRLGMGGGFYDRTLAFLNRRQYWFKPQVIGIGYDFQKTTGLIRQSWDVPLDGVVTPDNLYLR